MICFQRALRATVRAVGDPLVLLLARSANALPLIGIFRSVRSTDQFTYSVRHSAASENKKIASLFIRQEDCGGLIRRAFNDLAQLGSASVKVLSIHSAILTAGTSKRNGPLVLAHAGGNR